MGRQIPANSGERFAQFLPIPPVPSIPETAEPLIAMRLRHRCPCSDHLSAFASSVARRTDVIQSAKGRRQGVSLRKRTLAGGFSRAVDVKHHPGVSRSIYQPSRLLVGRERARKQIIEKERAQSLDWFLRQRC